LSSAKEGRYAADPSAGRIESQRPRRFARYLEAGLLAIGLTLLAVFLAFRIYGSLASRAAVEQFAALSGQGTEGSGIRVQPAAQSVDFGLWSEKRVEAYKQSLAAQFDTPIALLTIRKLSLQVPVFEGTEEPVLNRGVGRISGTGKPGAAGNIGIAGHRDGFFRCLKDIQIGDRIELATPSQKYAYDVDAIEIVIPEDVSVLLPRSRPALTLVTCYPFYFIGSAPKRFIVHASIAEADLNSGNNAPNSEVKTINKQEVTK
jgi:sortase A